MRAANPLWIFNFWLYLYSDVIDRVITFAAYFIDVTDDLFCVSWSDVKSGHVFASSELPAMEIVYFLNSFESENLIVHF